MGKVDIRDLRGELTELGLSDEQTKDVLKWVDTIPIQIYGGENIQVRVNRGGVIINEDMIDYDDLSFNLLDDTIKLNYSWFTDKLYNPFEIPKGVKLMNPFTGKSQIVLDAETKELGEVTYEDGEEVVMRNPFNMNVSYKFVYKNNIPIERWVVNDNNEWELDTEFKFDEDE